MRELDIFRPLCNDSPRLILQVILGSPANLERIPLFSFLPRDTEFFDLFDHAASIVESGAKRYKQLADDYGRRESIVAEIRNLEHQADDAMHAALAKLDTSFITPFDREDIHLLLRRMDDVIDEIDAAAKRFILYAIPEPTPWLKKQTEILVRATAIVADAVRRLRDLKRPEELHRKLVEIHQLENDGDDLNHAAVAELFANATDPILVMKWKEIYDLTERGIDRCEDIANTIEGIVLKNA